MADISDLRIEHPVAKAHSSQAWRSAFIALVVVVVLGCSYFVLRIAYSGAPAQSEQRTTNNEQRTASYDRNPGQLPLPSTFTAAGYVEVIPPGARIISSLIAGMVSDIRVQEGQAIRAGVVIATLDTSLLERELENRQAEVEVLHARLLRLEAGYLPEEIAQAEARVDAAKARLHAAKEYLTALQRIAGSEGSITGAAPLKVILDTQAELGLATAALAEAQAELQIKRKGTRPEDLAIARAEFARAKTELANTHWKIEQCTITSPVNGVVFQQLAQPGQWLIIDSTGDSRSASSGGAIVSIFDPSALQAWVDLNQRDVGRVRLGQRVAMIADALPGRTIEGRVIQFMPRASIERNTVRIKISIEGDHEGLRPDMSLRVTFHD